MNTEAALATAPAVARPVMTEVATQAEIARIQAAVLMAQRFPRDPVTAQARIQNACASIELAEEALYSYSRGGNDITGPSIRLAECIAQHWGRIDFGVKELDQNNIKGESTVEAFAWDLETLTRRSAIFQVPHVRYSREKGRQALGDDPRDTYEVVANNAARRLRACILAVIPTNVVSAAVRQVEVTLKTKGTVTPDRIKTMLEAFAQWHVTREQIEKRIQRNIDAIQPAQMVQLGKILNSLRDNMSKPADWFEVAAAPEAEPPTDAGNKSQTQKLKETLKQRQATQTSKEGKQPKPDASKASSSSAPPQAAGEQQRDMLPMFDKASAIAALKACKTQGELQEVFKSIIADFRSTDRELPVDIEAVNNELGETLPEEVDSPQK